MWHVKEEDEKENEVVASTDGCSSLDERLSMWNTGDRDMGMQSMHHMGLETHSGVHELRRRKEDDLDCRSFVCVERPEPRWDAFSAKQVISLDTSH